ncbi:MAG: hypothetical protein KAJ18_11845 [Candidatus Omnitrophica bacterium]|nr:hypothetical protein [Candidatus Omnitrophota bacterium]
MKENSVGLSWFFDSPGNYGYADMSTISIEAIASGTGHVYGDGRYELSNELMPVGSDELQKMGLNDITFIDENSGFKSGLYKTKTDNYVYIFAGTDDGKKCDCDSSYDGIGSKLWLDKLDMHTNYTQGVGLKADQYQRALNNTIELINVIKIDKLLLAGQSLGGGLSSATGTILGINTITFNSAGVHNATLRREKLIRHDALSYVVAYYIQGDLLSYIQDRRFLPNAECLLPSAIGRRIEIPSTRGVLTSMPMGIMNKDARNIWRAEAIYRHSSIDELVKAIISYKKQKHLASFWIKSAK